MPAAGASSVPPLLGDLRSVLPLPWSEVALVAVSLVCGALVGFERERQEKPAGLRTLMLICIGSTVFTIASLSPVFGAVEPARIAAQIVTGVGFLGAGSILQARQSVRGLTTAASIWATAAVGIVVGGGYAAAGLALAGTILLTLSGVSRIESLLDERCALARTVIVFRPHQGKTIVRITHLLGEQRGPKAGSPVSERGDGLHELTIEHCPSHREHRAALAMLAELPEVEGMSPL